MRINLPSGFTVEVMVPNTDFPRLISEAVTREALAHDDVVKLKKMARSMEFWPVADEQEPPLPSSKAPEISSK